LRLLQINYRPTKLINELTKIGAPCETKKYKRTHQRYILHSTFFPMLFLLTHAIRYCIQKYMTLWRDHFRAARFVAALIGVAYFVAGPFWSRSFWRKFHKNNFFFCFFQFFSFFNLYYYFFRLPFFIFFSNAVEDFLFIFNKFLST